MAHLYPFTSPLDSLAFDSSVETNKPLDMETEANLTLWTNAQFTFDVQPGSGILEEKPDLTSSTASLSPLTPATTVNSPSSVVTYENLANYLDYELPQQQQQQLQQQIQSLQSIATPAVANTFVRAPHQQLLLPKISPAMSLEEITKAFLSAAPTQSTPENNKVLTMSPSKTHNNTVMPMEITPSKDEKAPAEEDKRRRNTAASARFRIKKKLKEQNMEKTVREMTEKSSGLEERVRELELEIKWLRGLLIEKNTAAPESSETQSTAEKSDSPTTVKVEL